MAFHEKEAHGPKNDLLTVLALSVQAWECDVIHNIVSKKAPPSHASI